MSSLSSWTATQFDPKLSWDDVKRFQDRWGGKLILKGILDPEDAAHAAATRGRDHRVEPRRAAARRGNLVHRRFANNRRGGRLES